MHAPFSRRVSSQRRVRTWCDELLSDSATEGTNGTGGAGISHEMSYSPSPVDSLPISWSCLVEPASVFGVLTRSLMRCRTGAALVQTTKGLIQRFCSKQTGSWMRSLRARVSSSIVAHPVRAAELRGHASTRDGRTTGGAAHSIKLFFPGWRFEMVLHLVLYIVYSGCRTMQIYVNTQDCNLQHCHDSISSFPPAEFTTTMSLPSYEPSGEHATVNTARVLQA
ncbi:hypothetical protein HD554DRAFT_2071614 [Boletus coccyginus]|nr:hypothetical protein HD554DRAFT_2071614 [Boletus coccyginus]